MAIGKSNVAAAQDTSPAWGAAKATAASGSQDNGFGDADDSLKKFNHQSGTRAHDGDALVMYVGARLQGNVGDHVHYADQEASSG